MDKTTGRDSGGLSRATSAKCFVRDPDWLMQVIAAVKRKGELFSDECWLPFSERQRVTPGTLVTAQDIPIVAGKTPKSRSIAC